MNPSLHVAVIGAGIAGLSCAVALQHAGCKLSVFDKSRGVAGRMSTRRDEDWQCDHGAQYFTARDPQFRVEVGRWLEAGVAAEWTPRLKVLGGVEGHIPDPALRRYVGVPQMTAPARFMARSLAVRTQTTITQLERQAKGWRLHSAEHGWLEPRFDAVLLALPAPQALTLLEPASELAALAASATMRGSWALMLRYDAPLALPFDAAFVNHGPLRWVARDSSKPGRARQETWLLHATADWSEVHLEHDAPFVAGELLAAFEQLGGTAPHAWTAHRWRYADSQSALNLGCAWNAASGLGLCGDWINRGKVEGAWRSGRQLAQAVLRSADGQHGERAFASDRRLPQSQADRKR